MATKVKQPAPKIRITAAQVNAHRTRAKVDLGPKWINSDKWSTAEFKLAWRNAMAYYRIEADSKTYKPYVLQWMHSAEYSKDVIKQFKATKDWRVDAAMGGIAASLLNGMCKSRPDFNEGRSFETWLRSQIVKTIEEGKFDAKPDETVVSPVVDPASIQEKTREIAMGMTGEIEDAIEKFYADKEQFNPKEFKMLNLLKGKGAKAQHVRYIKEFYERDYKELEELTSGKASDQLKEGYKHLPRKYVKKLFEFYSEIISACTMLAEEAKVARVPKVKPPVSKEKQIEKLKFLKTFSAFKLVSINPIDIISSKELWCFNVRTRKIGRYIASDQSVGLDVKGSAIIGYDENTSIQKTIRQPLEKLAEFKAAGKIALRKFMDNILTVDTKLTGRINEDVILLKTV